MACSLHSAFLSFFGLTPPEPVVHVPRWFREAMTRAARSNARQLPLDHDQAELLGALPDEQLLSVAVDLIEELADEVRRRKEILAGLRGARDV